MKSDVRTLLTRGAFVGAALLAFAACSDPVVPSPDDREEDDPDEDDPQAFVIPADFGTDHDASDIEIVLG